MTKAISTIIASVLMLMITIALAGTAYVYISGIFTSKIETAFTLIDSNNDTVIIRNAGTSPINTMTATLDGSSTNIAIVPYVSGLVAYWSFNEGSGTIAADSSGNKINFEIRSLVNWVDGKFGKAIQMDNSVSTGCIDQNAGVFTGVIPPSIANLPSGAFTQVYWVKPSSRGGLSQVAMPSVWVSNCGFCSIWNRRGSIQVANTAGIDSTISYTMPSNDIWHQFAYVFDLPNLRQWLYIDGQPVSPSGYNLASGNYSTVQWLSVGAYHPTCPDATPGAAYDEYSIYNRALSQQEIQQLYSGLISPGQIGTIKPFTSLTKGTHTLRLCTSSMCNTAILTII